MLGVCSVSLNLFVYFPDGKAEERLSTIARKRKSVSGIHFCPFLVAYTHESVSLFHAFRWWGASFKIVRGENEGKSLPSFFFPRLFFAHALLSERLEQATSPLTNHLKCILWFNVISCFGIYFDRVLWASHEFPSYCRKFSGLENRHGISSGLIFGPGISSLHWVIPITWNPKYPHWDNAIPWINLYPLDNAMGFPNWGQISGFYYAVKVNK